VVHLFPPTNGKIKADFGRVPCYYFTNYLIPWSLAPLKKQPVAQLRKNLALSYKYKRYYLNETCTFSTDLLARNISEPYFRREIRITKYDLRSLTVVGMKFMTFWDVLQCCMVNKRNVSKKHDSCILESKTDGMGSFETLAPL
jgi:hypothetical protein